MCHHGGRPRFLAAPPLTLNFAIDGVEGNFRAGEKPFKAGASFTPLFIVVIRTV